jgi:WD40 repeat protein
MRFLLAPLRFAALGLPGAENAAGGYIYAVDFSPDSQKVVTVGQDGTARVWSALNGSQACQLGKIDNRLGFQSVVFSPDGSRVVGTANKTCVLWDVKTHRELWRCEDDRFIDARFTPDGKHIVSCCGGVVSVRDANNGDKLDDFKIGLRTEGLALSRDGQRILTVTRYDVSSAPNAGGALSDRKLAVYDLETGQELQSYQPVQGLLTANAAWSHDEKRAFVVFGVWKSSPTLITVDLETGDELHRLPLEGHDSLLCIDASPTDNLVATCGIDKTVRLWRPGS